ncbi:MAG: hypothetical protein V7L00_10275 [Nostoc sp.]|uniref:hypothetical protein n=1 Tax=Nostoc sp. TaxID=1180 RepID=UPI002FFA8448
MDLDLTFHGIWKTSLLHLSPKKRSHCYRCGFPTWKLRVSREGEACGVRDFEFSPLERPIHGSGTAAMQFVIARAMSAQLSYRCFGVEVTNAVYRP